MLPHFNKIHNKFKLNGVRYNNNTLREAAYDFIKEGLPYQKVIGNFLMDWLNNKDFIKVTTSGSTGNPKVLSIKKQSMVYSAIATGNFFGLTPGNSALHCLPTEFIAGKMMLVRALILGLELDLIQPNSHPLASVNKPYDFCAMVPLQLQNSIPLLKHIKTLIVGGAAVSKKIKDNIQDSSCDIYATYGMTETVSHIAVKKLNNGIHECYQLFPEIHISIDKRDCLVINAPKLIETPVITNDVIELCTDTSFKLLGRIDNVINSGGVKLFPEQIEKKLARVIQQPFFVASKKNDSLGEHLILVIEGNCNIDNLSQSIKDFDVLNKFEIPKEILSVPQFVFTNSGKIKREQTLELI